MALSHYLKAFFHFDQIYTILFSQEFLPTILAEQNITPHIQTQLSFINSTRKSYQFNLSLRYINQRQQYAHMFI